MPSSRLVSNSNLLLDRLEIEHAIATRQLTRSPVMNFRNICVLVDKTLRMYLKIISSQNMQPSFHRIRDLILNTFMTTIARLTKEAIKTGESFMIAILS